MLTLQIVRELAFWGALLYVCLKVRKVTQELTYIDNSLRMVGSVATVTERCSNYPNVIRAQGRGLKRLGRLVHRLRKENTELEQEIVELESYAGLDEQEGEFSSQAV